MFGTWYTDQVEIYRVVASTEDELTRNRRTLVDTKPCRVYTTQISGLVAGNVAAKVRREDKLSCELNVDIRSGDELIVTRGALMGHTDTERYFAGTVQKYYDPVGGGLTGLQHMEVGLLNDNIVNNSISEA